MQLLVCDHGPQDAELEAALADAIAAGASVSRLPVSNLAKLSAALAANRPFLTLLSADSPFLVSDEALLVELACPLLLWR